MQHTSRETSFIARRRLFSSSWKWAGSLLLLMLVAIAAWIWFSTPHLIDPRAFSAALQAGEVSDSTIQFMAMLLPVVVLFLFCVVAVVLLLAFAAFRNERRLIDIIDRLQKERGHV
jgi:hypothetical protein